MIASSSRAHAARVSLCPDRAEQWLGPGSMLERFNFAFALSSNKLKGTHIDQSRILGRTDLSSPAAADHQFSALLPIADLSEETKSAIDKIVKRDFDIPSTASTTPVTNSVRPINIVKTAVGNNAKERIAPLLVELVSMMLGSPEFQRR